MKAYIGFLKSSEIQLIKTNLLKVMCKTLSSDKHLHIQEKYLTGNVNPVKYGEVICMHFSETHSSFKYTPISLWKTTHQSPYGKPDCVYVHPDFQLKVWKKPPVSIKM